MTSALTQHERLHEVCERYGIARLEVFGSAARGEDTDESDIDLLYALAPGVRLGWAGLLKELTDELEQILGHPVDPISRNAIHARLRDVLAEAKPLYAAA